MRIHRTSPALGLGFGFGFGDGMACLQGLQTPCPPAGIDDAGIPAPPCVGLAASALAAAGLAKRRARPKRSPRTA